MGGNHRGLIYKEILTLLDLHSITLFHDELWSYMWKVHEKIEQLNLNVRKESLSFLGTKLLKLRERRIYSENNRN